MPAIRPVNIWATVVSDATHNPMSSTMIPRYRKVQGRARPSTSRAVRDINRMPMPKIKKRKAKIKAGALAS